MNKEREEELVVMASGSNEEERPNEAEEKPFADRSSLEESYERFRKEEEQKLSEQIRPAKKGRKESLLQHPPRAEPEEKRPTEVAVDESGESETASEERMTPEPESERPKPEISESAPKTDVDKDIRSIEAKWEERYKDSERKRQEAIQEAAELRRQLKFVLDTLQEGKAPKTPEPKQEEKPKSVLDLSDEELAEALLQRPKTVLDALRREIREEAEREASKKTLAEIEDRVKKASAQRTAELFKSRLEESDRYFGERYADMKPYEKLLGIIATHSLATTEGRDLLMKDPKLFTDRLVQAARDMLGPAVSTPTRTQETPPEPVRQEAQETVRADKRQKLVGPAVVKPSYARPGQEEEEHVMSPEEYLEMRRTIQDRLFTGH